MTDYTYNTGNPIGSTDVRDGVDNLKSFDVLLNSTDDTYQDRLGNTVPTAAGAIKRLGPVVVTWTFTTGGTLNYPNETALNPTNGNYYGWDGEFPKVVAPGTDPTLPGSGYVPRTDIVLRNELAGVGGAGLIGGAIYSQIRAYTGNATTIKCIGRANVLDGAFGVFVRDISDTASTDNDGTILIDALSRRWKRQFSGAANVLWFGAKGDGVTNDTTAIQKAFNTSYDIFFPRGSYLSTALTVNARSKRIYSDSWGARLVSKDNTSILIDIPASSDEVIIENLLFTNANGIQRTGGTYIRSAAYDTYIYQCKFTLGFVGIEFTPSNSIVEVKGCHFRNFNTNSTSSIIKINSTGADFEISECVFDNLATAMPYAGIEVNSVQDLIIADCNIIHCGIDLCIQPTSGSTVASVWANNTFFDTATYGVLITDNNGGNVVRCRFDACWASSNTQYGVYIDTSGSGTVDGITFIDLNAYLNGQDGLHCNGGNITIDGGIFANNKGSGISLASGSDRVYMSGVKSGAFSGLAGNKYGLFVDAGCTRIDILDSRFDSNTTSNVINGSTNSPSLRVARNAGYRTFAKGQATMPAGSTNVVVNHGLAMAPSSAEVMLSMASNLGNATRFWVSEATATSFTISVNSDPSLTLYFNWEINLEARGG